MSSPGHEWTKHERDGWSVWEERNRELVRERDEARAFLRRTAMTGGSIVSSAAMTETQIAIARAADRMLVVAQFIGQGTVPVDCPFHRSDRFKP